MRAWKLFLLSLLYGESLSYLAEILSRLLRRPLVEDGPEDEVAAILLCDRCGSYQELAEEDFEEESVSGPNVDIQYIA